MREPTPAEAKRARVAVPVFLVITLGFLVAAVVAHGPARALLILGVGLGATMTVAGFASPWYAAGKRSR